MLRSLSISNYALIDSIEIEFVDGFSVITGETGAGKSIILGALSLIVGQRIDSGVLKDDKEKCVVEATFSVVDYHFESWFEQEDVDYDDVTTIRREILPSGKSRAFVNDTPVNLTFLRDLTSRLIDIHSQHQNLLIANSDYQLNIVDVVAGNDKVRAGYFAFFKRYKKIKKEKAQLIAEAEKQKADEDYFRFQYEQLEQANLKEGEFEELEKEQGVLLHAEEIKLNLSQAVALLSSEASSVVGHLKEALNAVSKVDRYIDSGAEYVSRINTAYIDLKDLAQELDNVSESIEYEPDRIQFINERVDLLLSLQQKHHSNTVDELLVLRDDLGLKLNNIASFEEQLAEVDEQLRVVEVELEATAKMLTDSRKKEFDKIESQIVTQLKDLGMPNVVFKVDYQCLDEYTDSGIDRINYLFSANLNGKPGNLDKVASGGELSRVMLCIKALLSQAKGLPTIIFDEIDTGVSGNIADKMGDIMRFMGQSIQVLSITHLPQIAGKGRSHYKVFKTETEENAHTAIRVLSKDERVEELAKMLSGKVLTDAALSNARELLGM